MNWTKITDVAQLEAIDRESFERKVMIFKHSTRCNISSTALARVESKWTAENDLQLQPYFLDLIAHRAVSNAIEARYGVDHESPQVLIISNGKCIFDQSHLAIRLPELLEVASA